MQAYLLITARANVAQALAQIKALKTQLALVQTQNAGMAAAGGAVAGSAINSLGRWGSQLQWAGRQLQYNFTLPIVLAMGAASKFALDNEKAMTRVIKVYGDGSAQFNQLTKTEIPALGRAFEALSNKFGIAQADAINIAADWAAAGASGLALAQSVDLTMQTMVLGEMNATDATQALISIQAQYGLAVKDTTGKTQDLSKVIDQLNQIENQTGISMEGLIQGFARAAGTARSAGIDTLHLGAMLAALVPAAGSAANAGVALKTIISRLLAPTKDASGVMKAMGINVEGLAWQSLNGSQRLEAMATAFEKTSSAQKIWVSTTVAGRWQINKFDVLMRDIVNEHGYYQKALESSADKEKNFAQKVRELNAVLNSNPQKLKQIWTILQNAMADVIQPMIPLLLGLSAEIAKAMTWFNNLNPAVQKLVLFLLLFLAAIGPVARYVGAVAVLIKILGEAFFWARGHVVRFVTAMWTIIKLPFTAISTVVGAAYGLVVRAIMFMRDLLGLSSLMNAAGAGIATMFQFMATNFSRLAGGFVTFGQKVMSAVWELVLVGGAVFQKALAYLYIFFATQVPAILSKAATPIMAAGVKIWSGIVWALEATVAELMTAFNVMWGASSAAISRGGALIYRTALVVWEGIGTALGVAFATVKRMFLLLPWIVTEGMAAVGTAISVAGTAIVGFFKVIWSAIPVLMFQAFEKMYAIATSGKLLAGLRVLGSGILAAFTNPWVWAVAGVLALLYSFRDKIPVIWNNVISALGGVWQAIVKSFDPLVKFFNSIVDGIETAFMRLPQSIRDIFVAVIRTIGTAVMKIHDLFSYMNPFAKHSPSLVDSVAAGMTQVKGHYASVSGPGSVTDKTTKDLAQSKSVVAAAGGGPRAKFGAEQANVSKYLPQALKLFNELIADYTQLNVLADAQAAAIAKQQSVVDVWAAALKNANAALDVQKTKLDGLQKKLDVLTSAYDAHKSAMQAYADAPLVGMKAMNDAIFANDMAQKKLQLQMLQMGTAGQTIDDIKNKMAALAGSIEQLNGTASSLRALGAGGDILGPINDQVSAMQTAYKALDAQGQSGSGAGALQAQMDQLQKEAQILDLQKSITFDPLTKQINDVVTAQKEMTFADALKGVTDQRAAMDALTPSIAAATAAVNTQAAAVAAAQAVVDSIQISYDAENAKLTTMKDAYSALQDQINAVEQALRDMGSSATDAQAKLAGAAGGGGAGGGVGAGTAGFLGAAGAGFADVGGSAQIGRVGGLGDQSASIDAFTADISKQVTDSFGSMDMLGPLKDMWNSAWAWVVANVMPVIQPIIDSVKSAFGGININFSGMTDGFKKPWDAVISFFSGLWDQIKPFVDPFITDFKDMWTEIVDAGSRIWNEIGPALGDLFSTLGDLFKAIMPTVKVLAQIIGGALYLAFKVVSSILTNILGPVLNGIIDIVLGVIKIFKGFAQVFIGIFTGDMSKVTEGFLNIFRGAWDAIGGFLNGVVRTIWGIIKGFIQGIIDFFYALKEKLVGHSIIPDMINAMIDWFKSLPGKILDGIKALGGMLATFFTNAWNGITGALSKAWNATLTWIKSVPGLILGGLGNLGSTLLSWASTAWGKIKEGFLIGWNTLRAWENTVINLVIGALGDLGKNLLSWASTAWDKIKAGFLTSWTVLSGWLSTLWTLISGVINFVINKFLSWASTAWDKIKEGFITRWKVLSSWLATLWTLLTGAIGDVAGRFRAWAIAAWNMIKDGFVNAWTNTRAWLASLWSLITGALGNIGANFLSFGKTAFQKFLDGLKSIWDGAQGIGAWVGGLAGKFARALGGIGGSIANSIKGAWNAAVTWINDHGMPGINAVTSKFGFTLPKLPTFERGGVVPGKPSKTDNVVATLRSGEGVLVPEAVRILGGSRGISIINQATSSGNLAILKQLGVPAFARGGVVGQGVAGGGGGGGGIIGLVNSLLQKGTGFALNAVITPLIVGLRTVFPKSLVRDVLDGFLVKLATEGQAWGVTKDTAAASSAATGSNAVDRWTGVVQAVLDALGQSRALTGVVLRLIQKESGGNSQAINLTDSNALLGTPSQGLVQTIPSTFYAYAGQYASRGIYDPFANIYAGLRYAIARYGSIAAIDPLTHKGGYDLGGILKPGSTLARNNTGKDEYVLTNPEMKQLMQFGSKMDRLEAKINSIQSSPRSVELHFHGDLEFPNVKNSDDAEAFIKHLTSLTGVAY